MVISASRRTDIPALYPQWFMNRLREGYLLVRNPMNYNQISKIILTPENIDCIVFWTKDARPFIKHLNEINTLGYKYYFQFTLTPYDKTIETGLRDKPHIVETFIELSQKIGKEKVVLRYDPIILTKDGKYSVDYHLQEFNRLCETIYPYTERIVISFVDFYRKITKIIKQLGIKQASEEEMKVMAKGFSENIKKYGLAIETCAEKTDLSEFGIVRTKCIDGELIERNIEKPLKDKNKKGSSRLNCGCMKSIDIGQYDTCIHNCLYCYANISKNKALENFKKHNEFSPILME